MNIRSLIQTPVFKPSSLGLRDGSVVKRASLFSQRTRVLCSTLVLGSSQLPGALLLGDPVCFSASVGACTYVHVSIATDFK